MKPFIIVGGGAAGLLAARILKKSGVEFVGLERSDHLGGRLEVGHHRLYSTRTTEFLQSLLEFSDWNSVRETPQERKKGQWAKVSSELGEAEKFYLGEEFLEPSSSTAFLEKLVEEVKDHFEFNATVEKVFLNDRKLVCVDGREFSFERLIWAAPLNYLVKLADGEKLPLLKALKSKEESPSGLLLQMDLSQALFSQKNTFIFPFRYKNHYLKALGKVSSATPAKGVQRVDWTLFLDTDLLEDREEVAKCVRALKREVAKDIVELKDAVVSERIVFFPELSGETPVPLGSLEVLPGIFYLGPEVYLQEEVSNLRNLDLTVENCRAMERVLATSQPLAQTPASA